MHKLHKIVYKDCFAGLQHGTKHKNKKSIGRDEVRKNPQNKSEGLLTHGGVAKLSTKRGPNHFLKQKNFCGCLAEGKCKMAAGKTAEAPGVLD